MLVGGALALGLLATVGSLMANYAWREAQWEEIRNALRAAVSAAGPLLGGAGGGMDTQIEERVGEFLEAQLPRLDLDEVTVSHDAGAGVTTVSVAGDYAFSSIWRAGGDAAEEMEQSVSVSFEAQRYEVAVALDLSGSMGDHIPGPTEGSRVVKLDAVKDAMDHVATAIETSTATTPGSMMAALVPFASAVNAADTAGTEHGHTAGKERYLRMLAGADGTRAQVLARARDRGAQWVDTFHHYGVGASPGPLRMRSLPADLLDGRDWNLRRTDVAVDVADAVPALDSWVVDDEDFWNGCLMARWGAYWDPDARPAGWSVRDAAQWPARMAVGGWSDGSRGLAAGTPLHLSDAPPDADAPSTLFTAYSWPDSRIGGHADHRLQTVMARLLELDRPGLPIDSRNTALPDHLLQADNDWSVSGSRGGATLCPVAPVTPLTADLATLRDAVSAMALVDPYVPVRCRDCPGASATYLHLGVVWGLRALSPLWRDVWGVDDAQGVSRPAVPCTPGATGPCTAKLRKSILLISDGGNDPGLALHSALGHAAANTNPPWQASRICDRDGRRYLRDYHSAAVLDDEASFNARFATYLDDGHFGGDELPTVLDAFHEVGDRFAPDTAQRRALRGAALRALTPWELFRGRSADATDRLMDVANKFGFDRRPTQIGPLCRPSGPFGPYGRPNDHVYAGDAPLLAGEPLEPVPDVAPFNFQGVRRAAVMDGSPYSGRPTVLWRDFVLRLDDWFKDACDLADKRGVRVHAIFIGDARWNEDNINLMETCVDWTGGTEGQRDVFVTPNAKALTDAFAEIFAVRRSLRFLD